MLQFISLTNQKGNKMYGTFHSALTEHRGNVLIVHGHFSSNRIGPQRLYYEIAMLLCQEGYNVLRFDLSGMGESDGDLQDVKFDDHVGDLELITQWFEDNAKGFPISMIAHCIGCNIGLRLATIHPGLFNKIVCIAPYYADENTLKNVFSIGQIEELKKTGFTYRKGLYADASFFLDQCTYEKFMKCLKYNKSLLSIIFAGNDQFMKEKERKTIQASLNIPMLMIEGADHNFLSLEERTTLFEYILGIFK